MNLELIRKYEKEFLHLVHGGTLLSRVITSDEDDEMYTIWYGVNACNSMEKWASDYLFRLSNKECEYYKPQFIINDKYIEFRKALAEGKKIQFFNTKERLYNSSKPLHTWQDIDTIRTHGIPSDYRIKPEEPEFKIGDWITVKGPTGTFTECISGIADNTYTLSGTNICYRSQASKWEPKEDEVCIFWDNHSAGAFIDKFKYLSNNGKYHTERSFWNTCMPFTGILPPHMKDK